MTNEHATERVTILASRELLAEMEAGWSPPVQIRVERPELPGDHWEMTIRRVGETSTGEAE